uniref:Late embryogenesis abundant protein LEA-2 subgroup domain-containing protein n=1 Tax=Oryza barthii TaxID=65489 RepID=A0A0D3FVZ9_9ORYZ
MASSKWICYNVDDEGFHGRRQGCAKHVVVHSRLRRHGTRVSRWYQGLISRYKLDTQIPGTSRYLRQPSHQTPTRRSSSSSSPRPHASPPKTHRIRAKAKLSYHTVVAAHSSSSSSHCTRQRVTRTSWHARALQGGGRMHLHAKTDSEVTSSMAASSPPRAAYYVQSPSHDDGENKTAASSFHSSPAASPPRSLGNHSRESSSSRFSAAKSGSSRRTAAAGGDGGKGGVAAGRGGGGGGRRSPWMKEAAIEEEGLLMEDDDADGGGGGGGFSSLPRRWRYALGFVGAFFALFFFFALILWGASHNQKPVVSINSITFHNFVIQAGTDASLVPTELSTVNATVRMTFRNTGSFFGVHVTAEPLTLYYYQLLMASGNVKYFYQSRKSSRHVAVAVVGDKVPLYGGGSGLSSTPVKGAPPAPVPLQLAVRFRSRAFVLGKLVKPKFLTNVQCSVRLDVAKLGKPVSLNKACSLV